MSRVPLTPVSYVVLGLIARDGPSTPYALKVAASKGVANFWPFPHSQLYDEPARLAAAGLLHEEREQTSRRRRTYSITPAGTAALSEWLAEQTEDRPQIRSLAVLKLFFGAFATPNDLRELAQAQAALHEQRLREMYPTIEARLQDAGGRGRQLDALRMARDMEKVMLQHWRRLATSPSDPMPERA